MILSDDMQQVLEHYNRGLKLYKMKKFDEAQAEFRKGLEWKSDDGPTLMYIERCKNFIKNPPPADWDGVYTMTTK